MKFTKGLVLDSTNEDRPEGAWAHALNALFNKEIGGVVKEGGTENVWSPAGDYYILGHGTYQNFTVIFAYSTNSSVENIFLFNSETDTISLLFQSPGNQIGSCAERVCAGKFNWDKGTQIKAVLNKNTKDELIVYWISDDFPPCVFNIDKQKKLLDAGTIASGDIYKSDIALTCDVRWIDQLRLAPHSGTVPRINDSQIIEGGSLDISSYTLALQYEMEDGSTTGNLLTSLPVAIPLPGRNNVIPRGSESFGKDSAPIVTGSAIKWTLSNINTHVKYICPYIIKNSGNAEVGLKLTKIEVETEVDLVNRTLDIVYEGLEGEALADLNEIFNGNLVYSRARAIEQFDDKLYLANLEVDPIFKYQKYANAITLKPIMEDICVFDPQHGWDSDNCKYYAVEDNITKPLSLLGYGAGFKNQNGVGMAPASYMENRSYRNDEYHTHKKGYKRGETYAFYIAFIKADGSMSPAYHIPGREHVFAPTTMNTLPEDINENWFFQQSWSWMGANGMNYWKNQDEFYPASTEFDTIDITSGSEVPGISNQSREVRHHHFPHSHDVNYPGYYVGPSPWAVVQNESNTNLNLNLSSAPSTNQIYPWAFQYVNRIGGAYYVVGGSNTKARLAIVMNLNNWTTQLGDPTAWDNVGYGLVKLYGLTDPNTGAVVSTTAWAGVAVGWGTIKVYTPNHNGFSNLVYMEVEFNEANTDQLWTTFWPTAADLPSGIIAPTNHSFNMYDTGGNGWNGAEVEVRVNGVINIAQATIDTMTDERTMNFCATTGDIITLTNWQSGTADSEISWDMKDGCGAIIGSGIFGYSNAKFMQNVTCWNSDPTPALASTFVSLISVNANTTANSIILTGDGTTDLDALVLAWNTANPTNLVTLLSSNGDYALQNGATVQLANGGAGTQNMTAACNSNSCWNSSGGIWYHSSGGTYAEDASWMNNFQTCHDTAGDCEQQAVNILGFTLEDLAVPLDIAQQSQGFRIYRGNRLEADRTRMDQGLKALSKIEHVKLSNKKAKVKAVFQVPFYGIDGPGYYRQDGVHKNAYHDSFSFYGFETMRTRKILNEVTVIDKIYAFNEASTLSIRGPELFAAGDSDIYFENDTAVDELLTSGWSSKSSDVTCYDPWAQGFVIDLRDAAAVLAAPPAAQAWWGSNARFVLPNTNAPLFPWGQANGFGSSGNVGGVTLYTGVYHFLAAYDQVVNSTNNLSHGQTSWYRLTTRLEYIQGNTIESLRDFNPSEYAFNMGSPSYVLGFGEWRNNKFPSATCYYSEAEADINGSNPGSMYHNYVGNQVTGGTITYGTIFDFLSASYNEVNHLLPDNLDGGTSKNYETEQSFFQVVDLYAERRNVYNDFDTKDLVWTGYEVVGEEYNRFIVDVDTATPATNHTLDTRTTYKTGHIFGGDTFIAREYVRITHDGYDLMQADLANTWLDIGTGPVGVSTNSIYGIGANTVNFAAGMHVGLMSFIVESNENIALRHSTTAATPFAPQSSIHKLLFALDGICIGLGASCFTHLDWTKEESARLHTWDQNPCLPTDLTNHATGTNANGEEGIRYNEIYHYNNLMGNPIPVSNSIKEILTYPVRVTRSITGGGVSDTYRNFPELDFMDVQTDKGSIWNLFIHTGVLMIQSEDGLYKTKGSETLNTEQGGDIFVGSGNIFANAPELVATASLGVGGTTLRFSNYSTKWGYFYIDYNRRTINHFSSGLEIISDKGMREWFQVNIPIDLYNYGVPTEYEYTNTLFGFTLGLDARHNRLLITKRSYSVTASFLTLWNANTSTTGTDIRWNTDVHSFESYNGATWDIVGFNTIYFEEDVWTLSYYPEEKIWGSFHSYHPTTYICHDSEIYGYYKRFGYGGKLFKHNSSDFNRYGLYYDTNVYPFEVMHTINTENLSTKSFYALNVDTKWVNQNGATEHNIGFTHYFAHTDIQTTGLLELNYMDTYRGVGGSWQINDLRDRALLSLQDLRSQDGGGLQLSPVNLYSQSMFMPGSTTELNPLYYAVGAAASVSSITPGSNYTPGTTASYLPTSITTGSVGTGLDVSFTINGAGNMTAVTINNGGSGYLDGEIFSIPGIAQTPSSSGVSAFFTITIDKQWHQMRRIQDRYINIFLRDDNSVKNSLTLLDSSVLYKSYTR